MKPRITTTILVLSLLLALASWEQVRGVKARVMPATLMAALTVTNTNDDGAGSLRQAISNAAPDDTITFDTAGVFATPQTITLTSGQLVINKSLTINGPGAAQLTISGNSVRRGFSITSGFTVVINNLTVANSGDRFAGGGINNGGNLTLTNCTISGNYAASNGVLGGGIYNTGTATIIGCTISGNSAGNGGAIANDGGTLILSDSTLSGNSANSGGGGIYNFLNSRLTMTGCTLSTNTASDGGGIYMYFGGVTLTNCTFSGNSVSGSGGGIFNLSSGGSPLYATNCTFTGNSASEGGGIYNSGITGIKNTIIAGNSASSAINGPDLRTIQPVASFGNNLIGTTSGGISNGPINLTGDTASVISNQNPQLGPLANNGGATKTCALLSCSPATNNGANVATLNGAVDDSATTINVADATFFPGEVGFAIQIDNEQMIVTGKSGNQLTVTRAANSTAAAAHNSGVGVNPAFDQRGAGFSRQFGSAVDMGAFERSSEACPSSVVTNGNDSGPGSLRDALANAGAGSTITFVNGIGQITLTSAELVITKNVTISGPGANLLTISGNGARRVFTVNNGFPVVFEGLTIANGAAGGDGGGIYNYGNLTIRNSVISGNAASSSGGGIYNANGATLVLSNSTVSGNSCFSGGGISNGIAGVTLTNCTLSGNRITNSGGAILMCGSGTMVLTNCTISGNIARDGGGIYICLGSVYIRNTIIAGNTFTGSTSSPDFLGQITSQGYNLIGNNSGGTITPTTGDQIGTSSAPINPLLGPLADNGGPTQTHRLLGGSPAIDAGAAVTDPTTNQPLTTDQRGFTRSRDLSVSNATGGDGSDIGAFELQNEPLAINPDTLPDGAVSSPYTQSLNATGGSGNYLFSLKSGNLPSGLILSADGLISGTPTSFGIFTFTVLVSVNTIIDAQAERSYNLRISSTSLIPPPCVTAPSGLVSWWRAEGNANDPIGYRQGTLNGSATFSTLADGYDGQAFKFDGTNGYVALPNNLFPYPPANTTGSTPFSFELWFKSAASGGVILGQQTVSPYNTPAVYVPAIYVGTDGKLRVEMFLNSNVNPLASANTVNDNLFFHHVAVTYDGTQQKVYLDGQLMGSLAHTQIGYSSVGYKYQLGTGAASGWPGGRSGWFNFTGLIDEPSLYNRALTAEEVLAIFSAYNGGKCFPCPMITATVAGDGAVCTGGSATVTVNISGGVAPYTVTLNNEGGTQVGSSPLSFSVSPTADTTYAVQSATDANRCAVGATGSATVTVNPILATPTISTDGPTTFCAGGSVTLNSSSATDNQWYIDGSPIGGAIGQSYVASAAGDYSVVVTPSGCQSASSAATSVTVNLIPATPTITPGGTASFCADGSVTLTSSNPSGNQWYLNGSAISGATGQTYSATALGNYTVRVTANDCSSAASAATQVTVNPATAITLQPVGQTVNVGQSVTFSVTASGAGLSYQWRKGTANINGAMSSSYTIPSVSTGDAGTYSVVVTGQCGSLTSSDATLIVNTPCATPLVSITGPTSGAIYAVGTPVNFTGAFTDASGGTHTAAWTFDSVTQAGVVNETAGTVSRSYAFTQAGVYMVTLTVSNSCGQQGTANLVGGQTAMVVIYDPSAGFVTGGGWITSPLGAYAADPSLTGRANFAFVSRYQRGTTVPTGETEFIFQLAGLRFQSTAYEWLVVSGARGQFKGSGTINGAGNFGFLLTAIDGQLTGGGGTDKFRIKIWDRATGLVFYDNQMGASDSADPTTVIGGGSIVIQSR